MWFLNKLPKVSLLYHFLLKRLYFFNFVKSVAVCVTAGRLLLQNASESIKNPPTLSRGLVRVRTLLRYSLTLLHQSDFQRKSPR